MDSAQIWCWIVKRSNILEPATGKCAENVVSGLYAQIAAKI